MHNYKTFKQFIQEEMTEGPGMTMADMDLTSLEGYDISQKINGNFLCGENYLTSLEFGPKEVTGNFECCDNNLTSLKFCPSKVSGKFDCGSNKLTSLQGIHKLFKGGYIKEYILLHGNPITSHMLGLLLIPELKAVKGLPTDNFFEVIKIINKHLQGDRDVIDCQQELIEAGFKAYAQL